LPFLSHFTVNVAHNLLEIQIIFTCYTVTILSHLLTAFSSPYREYTFLFSFLINYLFYVKCHRAKMKVHFKTRNQIKDSRGIEHEPLKTDLSKTDGVPVLTYGTNSNLLEFRKQLAIKAQLEYGELGKVVETLTYPTFPPVVYNAEELSKTN